jgi:hypothetical protein
VSDAKRVRRLEAMLAWRVEVTEGARILPAKQWPAERISFLWAERKALEWALHKLKEIP